MNLSVTADDIMPKLMENLDNRMPLHDFHLAAAILHPSVKEVCDSVKDLSSTEQIMILTRVFETLGLDNKDAINLES